MIQLKVLISVPLTTSTKTSMILMIILIIMSIISLEWFLFTIFIVIIISVILVVLMIIHSILILVLVSFIEIPSILVKSLPFRQLIRIIFVVEFILIWRTLLFLIRITIFFVASIFSVTWFVANF